VGRRPKAAARRINDRGKAPAQAAAVFSANRFTPSIISMVCLSTGSAIAPASVEADFIKLETVVPEQMVESVVAAIARAAHTGRDGDGIVFVVPVEQFVRIRDISGADSRAL
jgi:hypothetical protein